MKTLSSRDIDEVCWAFEDISRELPRGIVVFCIITSITSFEARSAYDEDTIVLFENLIGMVDPEDGRSALLKLLFANPSRSRTLQGCLDQDAILTMPEAVSSAGGLARTVWDNTIGESVPKLLEASV